MQIAAFSQQDMTGLTFAAPTIPEEPQGIIPTTFLLTQAPNDSHPILERTESHHRAELEY